MMLLLPMLKEMAPCSRFWFFLRVTFVISFLLSLCFGCYCVLSWKCKNPNNNYCLHDDRPDVVSAMQILRLGL